MDDEHKEEPLGMVEFLLNALSFLNDPLLLNDPSIWIADMAATLNMSSHKVGVHNL